MAGDPEREAVRQRHAEYFRVRGEYFAAYAEQMQPKWRRTAPGRRSPGSSSSTTISGPRSHGRARPDATTWSSASPARSAGSGTRSGRHREGVATLDAALAEHRTGDPVRTRPLLERAFLCLYLGDIDRAATDAQELLELTEHADPDVRSETLLRLGLVAHERGDHAAATARYEEVVRLCRPNGDLPLLDIALGNLADIALREGHFEQSAALSTESVELEAESGLRDRAAMTLLNLGSALLGWAARPRPRSASPSRSSPPASSAWPRIPATRSTGSPPPRPRSVIRARRAARRRGRCRVPQPWGSASSGSRPTAARRCWHGCRRNSARKRWPPPWRREPR